MAVTQNPDLSWKLPVWKIEFEGKPATGQAILTLAIAGAKGRGRIHASLNGETVGLVEGLHPTVPFVAAACVVCIKSGRSSSMQPNSREERI